MWGLEMIRMVSGKHIFIVLLITIPSILYYINIPMEFILAIIAIYITIFIAHTQVNQLKKLEDIGNQTKETTEKLKTESIIRKNINILFPLKDKGKKYKCFFPVEYKAKPLPMINQGDFYAIHVVSTCLGEDNLDLEPIAKDHPSAEISLESNAIFICAPHANPALKMLFDIKEIKSNSDEKQLEDENWPVKELDLPCWFVEDSRENSRNAKSIWITRKIWIYGENIKDLLKSPAEDSYKDAHGLEEGKEFKYKTNNQQDLGIFARINKNDNQYVIIAGLHQYGTWIVGSFLSKLLDGENVDYRSTFLSGNDFIAVIWGEFNNKKLTINSERMGVFMKYIWTKESGKWVIGHSDSNGTS